MTHLPATAALVVHIVAGSLGIIFGFVALSVAKGAALHRKSGMVFVYAMLTMALLGSTMAGLRGVAPAANVPIGFLTAYLVITGLLTVRPPFAGSHRLDSGLMLVALGLALTMFTVGFEVLTSPTGKYFGMPAFPFLIFGAIALMATIGDLRLIRSGGVQVIRGAPRLGRHLWRMSTALLIAAFSFFLGQAKVIPKPYRIFPLLVIPPLVVLTLLLYWMWRVRWRGSVRGVVIVPVKTVGPGLEALKT
ncbi:MAG: hypothetical protein JWM41_233 [Gemmatimonadetes bacterium]|nr:hypothetical protein [Gemmatimonadota bacterium]